ncbi:MAG: sulfatase family protein [Planctomycetota bacterium]
MPRSVLLLTFALAAFLTGLTHAAERPGIVLLMGDDHGWDETAYNGHPHVQTPVLDEMAATGLRLDRFYSAHPSCSPTRGSVITGRHPNRYGTFSPNWSIRPDEISIAQILSDAGYACGHFGKWHLGPVKAVSPTSPGAMGFHEWLSHDNFFELNPVLSRNGAAPETIEGESSEIVINETIRFIDQAAKDDKPFFAVVWFGSPHEPYEGLPEDLALYDDLPESYSDRQVSLTSLETGKQTKRPFRDVLRERLAEITAMDRAIGKLRDHLKKSGMRDDTIVWYCGDNGVPRSGRLDIPFRGQKGQVYEGGIRVPGVIEWPAKISKPVASAVNSVTSDMLPTICDIIDAPMPDRPLDGVSLVPLLDGTMTSRSEPICFWMYDTSLEAKRKLKPAIEPQLQEGTTPLVKMMAGKYTRTFRNFIHPDFNQQDFAGPRAILDNQYKLVVDGPGGSRKGELFDIRSDPGEKQNLLEKHPEIAASLQKQLRDWQTSVLTSLTTDE